MEKLQELYVRAMVELSAPRKGQGLVEYALIIALVSVLLVTALTTLKDDIAGVFTAIGNAI